MARTTGLFVPLSMNILGLTPIMLSTHKHPKTLGLILQYYKQPLTDKPVCLKTALPKTYPLYFIEFTSVQSSATCLCNTRVSAESSNKWTLPKDYEGVSPGRLILFRKKSRPMVCLYCFPKASCANLVASDVWNGETKGETWRMSARNPPQQSTWLEICHLKLKCFEKKMLSG